MEILKRRGNFVVLHGNFFDEGTGNCPLGGTNLGEVFIKNYFDVLQEVVDVPAAQLSQEKKWVMDRLIIPRCRKVKEEQIHLSLDRLLDIVRDYYGEEPYYEEICKRLEDVLKERQS
jgi:glycosyltransferase, group 2 family